MQILTLKQQYLDAIRKDPILQGALAAANRVSTYTIDKWRRENDDSLTTATSLGIIRERLKLNNSIELTEPQEFNTEVENVHS